MYSLYLSWLALGVLLEDLASLSDSLKRKALLLYIVGSFR